jgi:hypothetical protein
MAWAYDNNQPKVNKFSVDVSPTHATVRGTYDEQHVIISYKSVNYIESYDET